MFDIIGKRFWYFLVSGVVILAGIIALSAFGLKPGVEFTSGSLMTVSFEQKVDTLTVKEAVADLDYRGAIIQRTGDEDFLIRLPEITAAQKATLETGLDSKLGKLQVKGFDSISPMIAAETTRNAGIAVVLSAIGMLLYITWAFRRMPNPFHWGVCAIASLVHDVLVVIGVFAIFGGIFGWQIDLMFVTGVLTVIGYSVNDTIVIFDRIRENINRYPNVDFEVVVNSSLNETMTRTLNTGIGTLYVLIGLILFVGVPIQNLVVVLLVGIVTGTYSSIGTAASLLVVWKKREWGRFIPRLSRPTSQVQGE